MGLHVEILTAQGADAKRWRDVLAMLPRERQDLHYLPEYMAIYEKPDASGMQARAALFESEAGAVLYPFMLRPVYLGGERLVVRGRPACDIATPYGIGGPVCTSETASLDLYARFAQAFTQWALDLGLASEFLCPHMYTGSLELIRSNPAYLCREIKPVVVIDVSGGPDEIRKQLNRGHKAAINKAMRGKVRIMCHNAPTPEQYEAFNALYYGTMDRHEAADRWYFDEGFFHRTRSLLTDAHCTFFTATVDGALAAWYIILYLGDTAYYHFAGSDPAFSALRPTTLLMHEVSLWAHKSGCKRFYLGGGPTSSPDDGILRFKSGFTKHTAPLCNAWRVLHAGVFDTLNALRKEYTASHSGEPGNPDFFPYYRS